MRIVTLAEGEVSELAVGLKGTMGALYLKDLADKTRRGEEGRIRKGRTIGKPAYGYRVVRRLGADGEPERGLREVDPVEAEVVRRIFRDHAAGQSPMRIARTLNEEGVPAPGGAVWSATTIRGRPTRRDGVLCNPIYAGQLAWNRRGSRKDPVSGRTVRHANEAEAVVMVEVPALRIVAPALWEAVQARLAQDAAPRTPGGRAAAREPGGRHRGRPAVTRAASPPGRALPPARRAATGAAPLPCCVRGAGDRPRPDRQGRHLAAGGR